MPSYKNGISDGGYSARYDALGRTSQLNVEDPTLLDEVIQESGGRIAKADTRSQVNPISREKATEMLIQHDATNKVPVYNASVSDETVIKNNDIYHSANLFAPMEQDYFHKSYRYGILNPYTSLNNCREYLFFTKPDLNIMIRNESTGNTGGLNPGLDNAFWNDLISRYPEVIGCLQQSFNDGTGSDQDPFNHLLSNMVQSNLDIPGITTDVYETPTNIYGVGYAYRGSSEASDDINSFSLEFKDTKYLPLYYMLKAYEEYEIAKHHGVVAPWKRYIEKKILHDQYSIYKFLVDEDNETIIYYAKFFGVFQKSCPREVFNQTSFDNGLSYSVEFSCAFVEDMNPLILADFNAISWPFFSKLNFDISVYNPIFDRADMRPARGAVVVKEVDGQTNVKVVGVNQEIDDSPWSEGHVHKKAPGKFVYKLRWRGDDAN